MIIAHFFTRKMKGTLYLMVMTSADKVSKPLFASPTTVFEAAGDRKAWPKRASNWILAQSPGIIVGEPCFPPDFGTNKPQCFDIPLYEEKDIET